MDNEKFEERLARLERLENHTVKRPAFEQFVLRVAAMLSLIGCMFAISDLVYQVWLGHVDPMRLIALLPALIFLYALFVVFKRAREK